MKPQAGNWGQIQSDLVSGGGGGWGGVETIKQETVYQGQKGLKWAGTSKSGHRAGF